MSLANSSTEIFCQTCANGWPLTDEGTGYYFRSETTFSVGDYASPFAIVAVVEEMTYCPKCDVGQMTDAYRKPAPGIQESPFYEGDSRMVGADVDKGGVDEGEADVVHGPIVDP